MPTCPYCAETIEDDVQTCPICRSDLTQPPPSAAPSGFDPAESAGMRMLLPVGRSGWAIVAGYLGLFSVLMFPAPLSVIVSIIALRSIKKNPKLRGMGRAWFGLIMGFIGSAMLALFLISLAGNR